MFWISISICILLKSLFFYEMILKDNHICLFFRIYVVGLYIRVIFIQGFVFAKDFHTVFMIYYLPNSPYKVTSKVKVSKPKDKCINIL